MVWYVIRKKCGFHLCFHWVSKLMHVTNLAIFFIYYHTYELLMSFRTWHSKCNIRCRHRIYHVNFRRCCIKTEYRRLIRVLIVSLTCPMYDNTIILIALRALLWKIMDKNPFMRAEWDGMSETLQNQRVSVLCVFQIEREGIRKKFKKKLLGA